MPLLEADGVADVAVRVDQAGDDGLAGERHALRRRPGSVTPLAGPTATMRPSRTRIVALSIGARSVPSITRAPVKAIVDAGLLRGRGHGPERHRRAGDEEAVRFHGDTIIGRQRSCDRFISWRHRSPFLHDRRKRQPDLTADVPGRPRRRGGLSRLYSTQPLLPLLTRMFGASTFEVGLDHHGADDRRRASSRRSSAASPIGWASAASSSLSAWTLTVATALAATSHSLHQLIFWRFVQGVATPGIFASTIAYIHEVWPPSHAGRAHRRVHDRHDPRRLHRPRSLRPRRRRRQLAGVIRRARRS